MSDTPKPATALSDKDEAFVAQLTAEGPLGIYGYDNSLRIIRDLDAKLVAARETIDGYDANQNRLVAENAALTERLRLAEERIGSVVRMAQCVDTTCPAC